MPVRLPLAALTGAALLALAACNKKGPDAEPTTPAQVNFTQVNLYPEGTQYDVSNSRYLVSSQTAGRIGQVKDDGTYAAFADDPALVSSIGLFLDREGSRSRLLAAVSDPGYNAARTTAATQGKLARLVVFDSNSGTRTAAIDLGGLRPTAPGHFANDVAVDNQGNAYVTDSFAPIIYKVDLQGTASVFLENSALAAPAGKFGLNGIVYHPDGYLLVAKSDEGALLKVPLSNPSAFTRVSLPAGLSLAGDDGIQLRDSQLLAVVCNAQGQVYQLRSTDGFASVSLVSSFATGAVYPTTLARRGSESYVLYSHLDALQRMQTPPVSEFSLTKVQY